MKKAIQTSGRYLFIFMLTCLLTMCESFVEIGPPKTLTVTGNVFTDDLTATSAIKGIYHELVNTGFANGSTSSVTFCSGTSSDELKSHTVSLDEFFLNSITPQNITILSGLWAPAYKYIYYSNSAIEGLSASSGVSAGTKSQLIGEAKFLRAFCYFYLTSLFGDVPLILNTDYRQNSVMSRTKQSKVFEQIIADLLEAKSLLSGDYQFTAGERVRATSGAAAALLARSYLYVGDWIKAETVASEIITNQALYKLVTSPGNVFLKNSTEAIWQFMPLLPTNNANEAIYFIPPSTTSIPLYASLTVEMATSFESGDTRRTSWVGSYIFGGTTYYYPFKYKAKTGQPQTEYSMVLRLAEQYLIRAEARAMQNKLAECAADLDAIRGRAGLASILTIVPGLTQTNLLAAVEQERKVELFSEWGHRWLDLKRWNKADQILQPMKGNWNTTDVLYPLPQTELNVNPNMAPQNPGY